MAPVTELMLGCQIFVINLTCKEREPAASVIQLSTSTLNICRCETPNTWQLKVYSKSACEYSRTGNYEFRDVWKNCCRKFQVNGSVEDLHYDK